MSEAVELRLVSRRELENVVLLLQGYASRLNAVVEEFTKPEWRVRSELDRVRAEFAPRVQFARNVAIEHRIRRSRTARNERYWRHLEEAT
ncbi:MAG: hypothetical protein ACHQ2Y_02870 [Candidatus Lutacidiplasmatales archaeon]